MSYTLPIYDNKIHNARKKHIESAGVNMLGLSKIQVSTLNFGEHTINAIEAELKKPNALSLEEAFDLYQGLSSEQIEGMVNLGLSREQVLTDNFGIHTIFTIKDILKIKPSLSLSDAFDMIKEKSCIEAKVFLKDFSVSNVKKTESITDMETIRVVVNIGRGFGHQRAVITLMQRLRELGFQGIFDVWCDDRIGRQLISTENGEYYTNFKRIVSANLMTMLSVFDDSYLNSGKAIYVPTIGFIKISSIPESAKGLIKPDLPLVPLCVSAGFDSYLKKTHIIDRYNVNMYLQIQPTDWHYAFSYVVDQKKNLINLKDENNLRLSSFYSQIKPNFNDLGLSSIENEIFGIISNPNMNTQLVYGLYPSTCWSIETMSYKNTGNLDEVKLMNVLIVANLMLSRELKKSVVLFLPQNIAQKYEFIHSLTKYPDKVSYCDLTKGKFDPKILDNNDVVIVHTGALQSIFFDYLLLKGTTLPPVIEGCNARELCEFAGRPFIYGTSTHVPLKEYAVEEVEKQKLHAQASICLKTGFKDYLPQLIQYMKESLTSDPRLVAYHKQRQTDFLARPDAVKIALDALGVHYKEKNDFMQSSTETQYVNANVLSEPMLVSYNSQRQSAFLATPASVEEKLEASAFQSSQKMAVLPSLMSKGKKNNDNMNMVKIENQKKKKKNMKSCTLT